MTAALSDEMRAGIKVMAIIVGLLTGALASRGFWWLVPIIAFTIVIGWMIVNGQRPITATWVLLAASMALATGVFLRFV